MTDFPVHTAETAPHDAHDLLETTSARYGSVPNILGVLVEAPNVAKAYLDMQKHLASGLLASEARWQIRRAARRRDL